MGQLPRLSPRPAETVSLNGTWQLQGRFPVKVPGELVMQGYPVHEAETMVYSRLLDIPAAWKGQRIKVRFDAVSSHATVLVNGVEIGTHEGGFAPFEFDITHALRGVRDTLTVKVQALTVSDYLGCVSQYAVHTVAGMLRKVSLFALPPVNIADLTVVTAFDKDYKNATLRINSGIANESGENASTALRFKLKDASGHTVFVKTTEETPAVPRANLPQAHAFAVKAPRHWSPESPYLYHLQVELLQGGTPVHVTSQKIGFRQVEVRGNELLVNGRPVKLRGVNRHDAHPLTGRSLAPGLDLQDALLFRNANCNYIRTSHYPPSEEFLQAADSLGLFVESEAALTWIQHHASPIWQIWNYTDEKFLPVMIAANAGNIAAGKNHPSVIIWSLGNESRWSPLWVKVNAFVKQMDASRPTTFHDQCWGDFNNAGSKADIAVHHYPGIDGASAAARSARPVLFGEYAHLACYNRRELATDPGVRAAYGAPLVMFYDSIYHYKGSLGGAIWSGVDDIFHLPGGEIVGYGPWGPVDAWRRPKPEYTGMKKAYEPVRFTVLRDEGAQLELKIENRYDFTSLENVSITANGARLATKIAPGKSGIVRIRKKNGAVHLKVTDPRGFVCVEELYRDAVPEVRQQRIMNVEWKEVPGGFEVNQGPYTWTISKTKGLIGSLRRGSDTLMLQGPVICVVPMNSDDGGKPNVAGETYQANIHPLKTYPLYTLFATKITPSVSSTGARIEADLVFTTGKGRQIYQFTTSGELIVSYEMKYEGKDNNPYQYGLLFRLPRHYEKMKWERKGEFTVYEADDIARTSGEALLNARNTGTVEVHGEHPAGSWKDDANELGSNDFRSTKRNVTRVTLTGRNGNPLTLQSAGKQHSRTWLQDGSVHWLIADYTNNGSEKFYSTPHSNGRINIRNQQLKGTTTISLP